MQNFNLLIFYRSSYSTKVLSSSATCNAYSARNASSIPGVTAHATATSPGIDESDSSAFSTRLPPAELPHVECCPLFHATTTTTTTAGDQLASNFSQHIRSNLQSCSRNESIGAIKCSPEKSSSGTAREGLPDE